MSKCLECSVCECKFELNINNHYIAREDTKPSVAFAVKSEEKTYDAFDCPNCGCQIIIGERKKKYLTCGITINYTGDEEVIANYTGYEDESSKDDTKDSNNTNTIDNNSDVNEEIKEYPKCFGKYGDENVLECSCCEYDINCRIKETKDKEKDKNELKF